MVARRESCRTDRAVVPTQTPVTALCHTAGHARLEWRCHGVDKTEIRSSTRAGGTGTKWKGSREICPNPDCAGKRMASSLILTAQMTQSKVIAPVQQRGTGELPGATGGF